LEKQRRGLKHMRDLGEAISDWVGVAGVDPKPYRLSGEFRADTGEYVFTGQLLKPMPQPLWGVMLGDGLHNLRSALDHLIYQLVLLDSGKPGTGENAYPISDTGKNYWSVGAKGQESTRERRLRGVSDAHKAIIDETQPYRARVPPGAAYALSALRDLSNHDKHRLLHVTTISADFRSREAMDDFFIANTDAGEREGTFFQPLRSDRETAFFAVKYSCPGPNPDVKVKGEPSLSVGLEDSRARLEDVLALSGEVEAIINEFVADFPPE